MCSHCLRSRHFGITVTVKVTVKLIFAGVHLGNMQIRGPDTPNHKDTHSIEIAMLKNYEIDTISSASGSKVITKAAV